jgi:hypothetical protein
LDKKEAKMNCLSKSQQSPSLHIDLKDESEKGNQIWKESARQQIMMEETGEFFKMRQIGEA